MNRLNLFDKVDTILSSFFPPNEDFYADIQGEGFKRFYYPTQQQMMGNKQLPCFTMFTMSGLNRLMAVI